MSEMIIFRLNQTPDKLYTQFLNLLGVRPFPSQPATVDLTFWLSAPTSQVVTVPAGTQASTPGAGVAEVFATTADLRIDQPTLAASLTRPGETRVTDGFSERRYARDGVKVSPSEPITPGDCFSLGFESSLAGHVMQLDVTAVAHGVGIEPERPPVEWEVWSGAWWVPCTVEIDTTGGLNRNGMIVLLVPGEHEPLTMEGTRAWWLRVR